MTVFGPLLIGSQRPGTIGEASRNRRVTYGYTPHSEREVTGRGRATTPQNYSPTFWSGCIAFGPLLPDLNPGGFEYPLQN